MADVLFTNVRIFDGGGEQPFTGDVLVSGNKISRVVKTAYGQRTPPIAGATVIDGAGAFLMPGMVEAHTHFSWNDQPSLDSIQRMPPEEHILWCAGIAERYLDMGWTSCVGAAAAKPRLCAKRRTSTSGNCSRMPSQESSWLALSYSKPRCGVTLCRQTARKHSRNRGPPL